MPSQFILDLERQAAEWSETVLSNREKLEAHKSRTASPDGDVIPEVNGYGRLTGLYLEPGIIGRLSIEELEDLIVDTVTETTHDALTHYNQINGGQWVSVPELPHDDEDDDDEEEGHR